MQRDECDSKNVLKSEGQHKAMCCELKAWPEGAVQGGFCPTGVMLSVPEERSGTNCHWGISTLATVVLQSGHGELPFHLKGAVREGERQRGGWAGTEGCRGH